VCEKFYVGSTIAEFFNHALAALSSKLFMIEEFGDGGDIGGLW